MRPGYGWFPVVLPIPVRVLSDCGSSAWRRRLNLNGKAHLHHSTRSRRFKGGGLHFSVPLVGGIGSDETNDIANGAEARLLRGTYLLRIERQKSRDEPHI